MPKKRDRPVIWKKVPLFLKNLALQISYLLKYWFDFFQQSVDQNISITADSALQNYSLCFLHEKTDSPKIPKSANKLDSSRFSTS